MIIAIEIGTPNNSSTHNSATPNPSSSHLLTQTVSVFIMATTTSSPDDDSFQLYDLKVEVVCPPGAKILCGAKEGDHFTLQGEMMYLPAGQGISIYSLGKPPFKLI